MFVEPGQPPRSPLGGATDSHLSLQQQPQMYPASNSSPPASPSRTSPRSQLQPHGAAVRALRRSISGGSSAGATGTGYDVYQAEDRVEGGEDGVVMAPEADDFAHEMLAMNTLAMQRCRAESLEEALQILNDAYLRISDCEQNGGQAAAPANSGGGNASGDYAGQQPGGGVVEPQLLDQLKATTLNNMGVVECHRGQPRQALSHFEGARQLEESWNLCSPSVALNTCAAYNALGMYDKATAAALETIDMLRTLEIQRRHQEKQRRKLAEEHQQQHTVASLTRPRRSIALGAGSKAANEESDDELVALITAGQPQIADSDNKALWGAAWHNLAVAQVNTARQAAHKNDVSSEFTNTFRIFQNAMKATQELLGMQHPMTRAVTDTYRSVRAAMRRNGAFTQHRTLMTAPPVAVDPREREAAEMAVAPAAGMTRHATRERQRKDLTITFRGPVTNGEKLMERVDAAAYPDAPEEPYRQRGKGPSSGPPTTTTSGNSGRQKSKKKGSNAKGCSSLLRSMPLSGTLVQASEIYGDPHPLLYSGGGGQHGDRCDSGEATDGVSWAGPPANSAVAAAQAAPSPPPRKRGAAAAAVSSACDDRRGRSGGSITARKPGRQRKDAHMAQTAPSASARHQHHHLPQLAATPPRGQQQQQSLATTTTALVDQSKFLLLAQPPAATASARTTYYPIDVPQQELSDRKMGYAGSNEHASGSLNRACTPPQPEHHVGSNSSVDRLQQQQGQRTPGGSVLSTPRDPDVIWKEPRGGNRNPVAPLHPKPHGQQQQQQQRPLQPTRPASTTASFSSGRHTTTTADATTTPPPEDGHSGAAMHSSQGRSTASMESSARRGAKNETATSTKSRELFDAMWVTADTHYVRSGNKIFGQSEYNALRSKDSTTTGGAAEDPITAVMSVDVNGSLVGITPKGKDEGSGSGSTPHHRPPYNLYLGGDGDEGVRRSPVNDDADAVAATQPLTTMGGSSSERGERTPHRGRPAVADNGDDGGDEFADRPSSRKEAALTPIAVYNSHTGSSSVSSQVPKEEEGEVEESDRANRTA